jgi:hypothetical protein
MTAATRRRLEVLDLRIRIERLGASAFDEACSPPQKGRQKDVAKRLLYLIVRVEPEKQPDVYRQVRLGRHVYRRTSDVLHGRVNAMDLSDVLIDEWRAVVNDLERVT